MWEMGATRKPTPSLHPIAETRIPVEHIELAVAWMGPGGNVPLPNERGVRGNYDPAAEPRLPGHKVGQEPVQLAIDKHGSEIYRDTRMGRYATTATECPRHVAACQHHWWKIYITAPRRAQCLGRRPIIIERESVVRHRSIVAPILPPPHSPRAHATVPIPALTRLLRTRRAPPHPDESLRPPDERTVR